MFGGHTAIAVLTGLLAMSRGFGIGRVFSANGDANQLAGDFRLGMRPLGPSSISRIRDNSPSAIVNFNKVRSR